MKAKRTKGKQDKIIQKIEITQTRRASQDINSWRNAIKSAESVYYPNRTALYDLYSEILLDGHLTAVVEKRKLAICNTPVSFVEEGVVHEEITALVATENFMTLMGYIIESKIWGHSLIELSFDDGTLIPTLIPRKHVVPQK